LYLNTLIVVFEYNTCAN